MTVDCTGSSFPPHPVLRTGIKVGIHWGVSGTAGKWNSVGERPEGGCVETNALGDEDDSNRTHCAPEIVHRGAAADKNDPVVERLWRSYFGAPSEWWDNRSNKTHPKSPDFRHKRTKNGLWTNSRRTPTWVKKEFERISSSRDGSLERCSASQVARKRWKDSDFLSFQGDVFYWTARISECNKSGHFKLALDAYKEMRLQGVKASSYTLVALLKACSGLQDLENAKKFHADAVANGLDSDVYVGTMLVDVYAKCGSLVDARFTFDNMVHRDVVSWNAMILGYAQLNDGEEALHLYSKMRQQGVLPNDRTFVAALKACGSLAACKEGNNVGKLSVKKEWLERVRAIHADVVTGGFESDVFVGNMLVDVYSKCGSLDDARCVFEKIQGRSVVSWTAMILGYAVMDEGEKALQLFAEMQHEAAVAPNDRTFVAVLKALSSLAAARSGDEIDGLLEQVRGTHLQLRRTGCESDVFVGTMLVDAYAKCRSLVEARQVFEQMPSRNVVSWTAMMLGYAQMEQGDLALQLYAQMQEEGVVPNQRTFVAALKACGCVTGLEKGKEIHAQILKSGIAAGESYVASCLIDMYSKCGSMVHAQQVFDALPHRDAVTWSALIAGYAYQGESEQVFHLFERSKQEGVQPDGVMFLSLLTACSHHGLLDKAHRYFELMSTECGITPAREHYSCMIDLLGRAGLVDRAFDMAEAMPGNPSGSVWRSILGACRKWGNVELGRRAFERAVHISETDSAAYVLMTNLYVAADMPRSARKVQAMRLIKQAWKKPGQSWWSDMGGSIHAFTIGEVKHTRGHEVIVNLQDLSIKLGEAGVLGH